MYNYMSISCISQCAWVLLYVSHRLAPMWQQSGTLIFCSCHEIAGFLVDELQIWIWRHFLEVLSDMTLIFIFQKEYIIFVKYVF